MASFRQRKFQESAAFLAKYFADTRKMDGIIMKIEVEEPYINYTNNPRTLQLADTNNNTILLYKADHRVSTLKGVTVMFTEDDIMAPAVVPKILEESYVDKVLQALKNTRLAPIKVDDFLNTHFVHGGMTPFSIVTRKPGWHKSFRDCVDVKVVSICRSCRKKANKGCCAQYSSTNRTTALMVIGWKEP